MWRAKTEAMKASDKTKTTTGSLKEARQKKKERERWVSIMGVYFFSVGSWNPTPRGEKTDLGESFNFQCSIVQ